MYLLPPETPRDPRTHPRTAHTHAHRAHFRAQKNTPKPDRKIHLLKGPRHPEKHPKTGQGLQNLARARSPPETPFLGPPKIPHFGPYPGTLTPDLARPIWAAGTPARVRVPKSAEKALFGHFGGDPPKTPISGKSGKSGRARARGEIRGADLELARISPADFSRSIL